MPEQADLPWQVVTSEALNGAVVVADDVDAISAKAFTDYVEKGGALFLPLKEKVDIGGLNALLVQAGVQVEQLEDAGFAELAWVNLNHRIFHPFKGARFNDFSSIWYDNYHHLSVDSTAVVLAKYDNDAPAIVECVLGNGRILIWTGGIGLNRTNLARTPRFVPLLHETLRYLAGEQQVKNDYLVGEAVRFEGAVMQVAGPEVALKQSEDLKHFSAPGVYQWGEGAQEQTISVNVLDRESDPARVTPAEFEIRLCDAPVLFQKDGEKRAASDLAVQREYGYWAIALLFVLLLVEHFCTSFLGVQGDRT